VCWTVSGKAKYPQGIGQMIYSATKDPLILLPIIEEHHICFPYIIDATGTGCGCDGTIKARPGELTGRKPCNRHHINILTSTDGWSKAKLQPLWTFLQIHFGQRLPRAHPSPVSSHGLTPNIHLILYKQMKCILIQLILHFIFVIAQTAASHPPSGRTTLPRLWQDFGYRLFPGIRPVPRNLAIPITAFTNFNGTLNWKKAVFRCQARHVDDPCAPPKCLHPSWDPW